MSEDHRQVEQPRVFISYSRSDGALLAEELVKSLKAAEFAAYLDRHDIEKAEDWENRLRSLILGADTVIFVVTPGFVQSSSCAWEIERAVEQRKRLIPIIGIQVGDSDVPEPLRRLNYIFFADRGSFAEPFSELVRALRIDLEWIRRHTLLAEQATRWNARAHSGEDLLLRGLELSEVVAWRARRKADAPEITRLQIEFIEASDKAERVRVSRARRAKATMVALTIAVLAVAFAWWQSSVLRETAYWLLHVRGHVLTNAQAKLLKPGEPLRECRDCPPLQVIPAGQFSMGSVDGEGEISELPQHLVTIPKPLAVGKFELTFKEWDACAKYGDCSSSISAGAWGRGDQPAINVSWDDAVTYVKWLARITGKPYRLLSEAEWEYATRGNNPGIFCFGNNDETYLDQYAWSALNSNRRAQPAGQKKPNKFGLHDVHGNVREWVQDCWRETYAGATADSSPFTSAQCRKHVVRGGSWLYRVRALRSAAREGIVSDARRDDLGFRIARDLQ